MLALPPGIEPLVFIAEEMSSLEPFWITYTREKSVYATELNCCAFVFILENVIRRNKENNKGHYRTGMFALIKSEAIILCYGY
jgi:hypothetical protein